MGSIIGLSFEPYNGYIVAAAIGGSFLPDIDLAYGGPGTAGYLDKHRTYTHSLWLAPAFSFILSLILYGGSFLLKFLFEMQPVDSFLTLWLCCFLGNAVHLLVDILNPFGTTLWWPKKDKIAIDILFEFDPAFTLTLILGIVVMLRKHFLPDQIWLEIYQIALITSLILLMYILLRVLKRIDFKKKVIDKFKDLLTDVKKESFVPAGLWRWKAILETEEKHYVIRQQSQNLTCEVKPKTNLPHSQVKEIKIYKQYARHLDVHVKNDHLILSNLVYPSKVLPLIGCFASPGKPLIKIEKPKWLRVLYERNY
ncbi:MAG TPA: metal-dependent hydrolase [Syntrophales bacterium]|nr:metal-dependent hydrolase [Syntrophales bacterium]